VADGITVQVAGLQDLLNDLRTLPDAIQKRVVLGMTATGASVIRKKAIALAPAYTGNEPLSKGHPPPGTLKKAIYQVRVAQECSTTKEVWKIDVRRGKRARSVGKKGRNLDAFYASWVEYGHFARVPMKMTKTAKAAGRALGVAKWIPPHPFMRPAVASSQQAAFDAMRDYLAKQLPLATAATKIIKAR
jgi:HK97 gp10 family phage protein